MAIEFAGGVASSTNGVVIAIGGCEFDADLEKESVSATAIVGSSLLGAVAGGVLAGVGNDLRVRSEQVDFGDVGALVRKRKRAGIELEKVGGFLIVTLTEEIGFADGDVGKWDFEGSGLLRNH